MAPTRQQRAKHQHSLAAACLAADKSRLKPRDFADVPGSNPSDGPATPTSGKSYNRPRAPRPNIRTASVVGIGCDMIFAPAGKFSQPVQI